MRIQHNIMAMNAYRNYNNNTKALSGNLEKLSSGYKINRAGDDAAGLAISEKMRAQITGLDAAQKNVKDGISLVKTAEGAMQEIQDMLNRMDYLATQSANGTYDNEVDRLNLQKEVDQLKTEINRIADSANFNGIKLLDGSLDDTVEAADAVTKDVEVTSDDIADMKVGGTLAGVGDVLGENTVLHNEAISDKGTKFDVDLHNFKFDISKVGNNMTLKVGDTEFKLTSIDADADALTGGALVEAILGKNDKVSVEVNGTKLDPDAAALTFESDGIEYNATDGLTKLTINGQEVNVEATNGNTTANGSLTFEQEKAPITADEQVNGSMQVTISGANAATQAKYSFDATNFTSGKISIDGKDFTFNTDVATTLGGQSTDNYDITVDGSKVTLTAKVAGTGTLPEVKMTADGDDGGATVAGTFKDGTNEVKAVYNSATFADKDALFADADMAGGTIAAGDKITIGGFEYTLTSDNVTTDTLEDVLDDFITAYTADTDNKYVATKNGANTGIIFTAKDAGAVDTADVPAGTTEDTKGVTGAGAKQVYDLSTWNGQSDVEVDGIKVADASGAVAGDISIGGNNYLASYDADKKELTLTAKVVGKLGGQDAAGTNAPTGLLGDATFTAAAVETKLPVKTEDKGSDGKDLTGITQGSNGDWNVSTTNVVQVNAGGLDRLASTYFELTEDMIQEGSELTIGSEKYTFTTDKVTLENDENAVDITGGDLATIAQRLTEKADGNSVWTVGVGKTPTTITLTETEAHGDLADKGNKYSDTYEFDLSTIEGIEKSLGFKGVSYTKTEVVSEAVEGGKALTLQIGDTSDPYNQMKVSVGDMHVAAMKDENGTTIADIDISTQEGAAAAVNTIKAAINYVSGVRGDLGAIQNRLDHTANNLSVMAENIQDAESTIRDTDVAAEMMSYVKNNILVQSAQAMLAQANQVPQGVLQLLG